MADFATTSPTVESATGLPEGVTLKKMDQSQAASFTNRTFSEDELASSGITLKRIDAPSNVVFDQDRNRTVGLPQTLNATETDYLIKRDVDGQKNLFGMENIGNGETIGQSLAKVITGGFISPSLGGKDSIGNAFASGMGQFILSQPQAFGALVKEQSDLAKSQDQRPPNPMAFAVGGISGLVESTRLARNAVVNAFGGPDEVGEWADRLIERNRNYLAQAGFDRPEEGQGLKRFMYDLGQGSGSLMASIGLAALTRSPGTAAVYFGALQKSQIYQEARESGMSPEGASDLSSMAGFVEGGLEFIGLDSFMKAIKGNTAVKRFLTGFTIEAVQEASQTGAEELITQASGVRDKELGQTAQDILYSGLLGGIIGGGTNAAIGGAVEQAGVDQGMDPQTAKKLGKYAEENMDAAKENMSEFIEKELAPIAKDDETAKQFITLMQNFSNDVDMVNRADLDPQTRQVFDAYIEQFNNSTIDRTGVSTVEKTFYDQALAAGLPEDEAVASSKVIGARADAASRALGITPQEWYASQNLSIQRQDKPEEVITEDVLSQIPKPDIRAQSSEFVAKLKERFGNQFTVDAGPMINDSIYVTVTKDGKSSTFRFSDHAEGQRNSSLITVDPVSGSTVEDALKVAEFIANPQGQAPEFGDSARKGEKNLKRRMTVEFVPSAGKSQFRKINRSGNDVLNQSQVKTDTKEFKDWFGDSKVVDADSKPLVVYHGGASGIEIFDYNKIGLNGRSEGPGFEFTGNKDLASGYEKRHGGGIYPSYLSIKNPISDIDQKTLTLKQREKILTLFNEKVNQDAQFVGDLGKDSVFQDYTDEPDVKKVISKLARDFSEDTDLDFVNEFINTTRRNKEILEAFKEVTGYDGVVITEGNEWADNGLFVVFTNTQIKSVNNRGTFNANDPNILNQGKEQDPRGHIEFGKDGIKIIRLFKDANPSTILHELGHLFLRDMRSVAKDTIRPRVKKDYDTIKKWLGAKGDSFTVDQEERFARGFEAYLREGKAPKPELQSVFTRFKDWLTSIYRSALDLNVDINDDIRQVFDRMLGGDFAQSERLVQSRARALIEQDYQKVAQPPSQSTIWPDTKDLLRDVTDLSGDAFVPVSTRLGNIDKKLKYAVRRFVFNTGLYTHEDRQKIKPFVENVSKDMTPEDYRIFDLALKNRDDVKIGELVEKYKLQDGWKAVRDVLDNLYNQAVEVGVDVKYIDNYFPRQVKPKLVGDYMAYIRNIREWSEIEMALREVDPTNTLSDEDKAAFVNNYLRGFSSARTNLARPSFTKERKIDYVTPDFNRFYEDSMPTLMRYVGGMRHGIESRKLFGKDNKLTDDNIGHYVLGLIKEGVIKPDQEKQLKKLLKAVVEPTGTKGIVAWSKNAGYIYLMGNSVSAITQIQDLAFSLHENGYWRTGKSVLKSLTNRQVLKKEDLGLENILQEFEDDTRVSKWVRHVFDLVGLSFMDNVGKETYIDASLERLKAANKKGGKAWDEQMTTIFGDQAAGVKQDLTTGTMSENVKYLLFSELSDIQPISLAEMPVGYLRGGNGRIFYMLKTYTIKQFDIYRREIFANLSIDEPKKNIVALRNLTSLGASLMLMGMATDALKDLILGRDIELSDLVMDNVLKFMGFSKFQIYKAKTDGIANTFWQTLFVPPVLAPVDDLYKDVRRLAKGDIEFNETEGLGRIPIIGKFYYWWWGGGRSKEENKGGKSSGNSGLGSL